MSLLALIDVPDVPAVCMCLHAPDEVFVSSAGSADSAGLSLDLLCPSPVSCNTFMVHKGPVLEDYCSKGAVNGEEARTRHGDHLLFFAHEWRNE